MSVNYQNDQNESIKIGKSLLNNGPKHKILYGIDFTEFKLHFAAFFDSVN